MLAAVLAPLVLGGCGMPLGVQIASLFADGVSLLTTDKTLTDHGLSAVSGEDCALWRSLDGKDICREAEGVELADAGAPAEARAFAHVPGDADIPDGAGTPADIARPAIADARPGDAPEPPAAQPTQPVVTAAIEPPPARGWPPPEVNAGETAAPAAAPDPAPGRVVETELPPPVAPPGPAQNGQRNPAPPLAAVAPDGGTFLVIGSYRRPANAERLARSREDLGAKVLAGTVRGLAVYRVAVGPLARAERRRVRDRLVRAGYEDVWAVNLEKPKLALELAAATPAGGPN